MTSIAIVEDNRTVRESLRDWIDAEPGYHCVCVCGTAEEAMVDIPAHRPDVVLMDIHLPKLSGIACTAWLMERLPALQIVMLTVYRDHKTIFEALQAGAYGYLLKRSGPEEIIRAIVEVRTGGAPISSEIARLVIQKFHKPPAKHEPEIETLSERELEILSLVCEGLVNKEIGDRLGISYYTVRAHLRRIFEKLHVRCRAEAVTRYLQNRPASVEN
jgi:DNA-binding NarL/FixJ family response regulator